MEFMFCLLMLDFLNREPYILKGTMVVDHKINITNHLNSENRSGKQFSDTFSEVHFLIIVMDFLNRDQLSKTPQMESKVGD